MRHFFMVLIAAVTIGGCDRTEYPFLQMDFCIAGEEDRPILRSTLEALARDHRMEFGDRSAEAEVELRSQDAALNYHSQSYPLLMMRIYAADGPSLSVNNVGLSANQVGMGFTAGKDRQKAQALAEDAIKRFSGKWKLRKVSSDHGITPRSDCAK